MKCVIEKASDYDYFTFADILTLQELLSIYNCLIIDNSESTLEICKSRYDVKDLDLSITIYDDSVEQEFFMDYFGYIVAFICGYLYKKYSFRFYAFFRAIYLLLKGFMIGRKQLCFKLFMILQ